MSERPHPSGLDPRLLEVLVCPISRRPLRWDPRTNELISDEAGLAYPIREGIPIMLPEEARRLQPGEGEGEPR